MFTTIRTTYTESTDMAREGLHWQNRTWSSINHQCVQHLCCHVLNHEDQKLTENCSRSLWRKLPWDSGASSFAKNRLQSIHGSKYCDYDSFRKHCCWYDWNRTPECNGKECICVILQSDKVISHLLAVFNISTHLPDFELFSVFLFTGNTLRWKRKNMFTWALAKLVVPWMNFAISVAESATSPREMKYLIPWDFKDQICQRF